MQAIDSSPFWPWCLLKSQGERHALLSQEGSAARRVARGEVPDANPVSVRLWNPLSRDFDFVSITLSP
jgi:hypothetical protein